MSLYENIISDLRTAMKQGDKDRLRVLRSLKTKMLEKEISERKGGEASLDDEQVTQVLMKAAKQRKESIEQFEQGGREDLAEKERQELEIIEGYLPEMLSEGEIREVVQKKIDETGADSMADMGKVMAAVMPQLKGKAEGALVSKVVKQELS